MSAVESTKKNPPARSGARGDAPKPEKAPKPERARPEAFSDSERAELVGTVARLRAKRVALSDAAREGYRSLATDAQCAERGKTTRGHGVARDLVAMAVVIDKTLDAQNGRVAEYSARRFAYMLECAAVLLRELDVGDADRARVEGGRGAVSITEVDAAAARALLLQKAEAFAGLRETERGELADARGTTANRAELASSIASLGKLVTGWLKRGGVDALLAEDVGLDAKLVDDAEAKRKRLVEQGVDVILHGAARSNDTPSINLAEGRCLVEMEAALDAFRNEHARNDHVPRLIPGAATRRALGLAPSVSKSRTEEGDDSNKGPTPPVEGTPAAEPKVPQIARKAKKKRSKR